MTHVIQLKATTEGPNITFDKPILLFGRHPECDVQLNSKKISRKHCVLAQHGDDILVRDLGSTNGVQINGRRTDEGIIRVGDKVLIGVFEYEVVLKKIEDPTKPESSLRM
jgi:pSer/pThr/pTyr-binding forkhead associated (FHA) protein